MQFINMDHQSTTKPDSHRSFKQTVSHFLDERKLSRLKQLFINPKPMNTTFKQLIKSQADKHFAIFIPDKDEMGKYFKEHHGFDIYSDQPLAILGKFSKGKVYLTISWSAPQNTQVVRELIIKDFESADFPSAYFQRWSTEFYMQYGDHAKAVDVPQCIGMFVEEGRNRKIITTEFYQVMELMENIGSWLRKLFPPETW